MRKKIFIFFTAVHGHLRFCNMAVSFVKYLTICIDKQELD